MRTPLKCVLMFCLVAASAGEQGKFLTSTVIIEILNNVTLIYTKKKH